MASLLSDEILHVDWKVEVLCALWLRTPPVNGESRLVPAELLRAALPRSPRRRFPGKVFLGRIRGNWPGSDGRHLRARIPISQAQKRKVEALPWFRAWIRKRA